MKSQDWDKISTKYYKEIDSPFSKGVTNPLFKEITRLPKNKVVADLGCGTGPLLKHLKKFKEVYAIDFSQGMLDIAKKTNKAIFLKKDLTKLNFKNKFDYAFSINSILLPSINQTNKIIKNIYTSLKKNGKLFLIIPAIEAELFRATLTFEREYKKCKDEKQAISYTKDLIGRRTYDFLTGFFNNKGKQKHFYKEEIEYKLKRAGFKKIQFKKVLYPWTNHEDYSPFFKDTPKLWDWFILAIK